MLLSPHWRSFLSSIARHFTLREYYVVLESNVCRKKKTIVMRCAICYHLYDLKNMKSNRGKVLFLSLYNFTQNNTPPRIFFTFFKFHE